MTHFVVTPIAHPWRISEFDYHYDEVMKYLEEYPELKT
jgi:hypothetical protein